MFAVNLTTPTGPVISWHGNWTFHTMDCSFYDPWRANSGQKPPKIQLQFERMTCGARCRQINRMSELQSSHASWKVLDFFLKNCRTWKVLENHYSPGKSWKLKLKVLESPGKISLKVVHFSSGLNGKQAAIV